MYPLGHVGTALVIASFFSLPITAFVMGVLLPDLLDKSLVLFNVVECSRSYGHTLAFAGFAGIVAFVVTRKRETAIAVALGCLFHLAEDVTGMVPFDYPFVAYDFQACVAYVPQPGGFEVLFEAIGAGLIVVWWMWRGKIVYLGRRIKAKVLWIVSGKS